MYIVFNEKKKTRRLLCAVGLQAFCTIDHVPKVSRYHLAGQFKSLNV
jgi:hypothetical protein